MILVIDNYDSFTYNLVQYIGELGGEPEVHRNDAITVAEVRARAPAGVVISPGPGVPDAAGISLDVVRQLSDAVPILGVCLGHQAIAQAFGGRIVPAERLMHGKTSSVAHEGRGIFRDLPNPLTAMRYHSLIVDPDAVPRDLDVTAWTSDPPGGQEIMGLQHRSLPAVGVQFHPESVGTEVGKRLVANFLGMAERR